ncbi:polyhydroxyalkanoic acid system family protein [Myxococcota bacterium]|nr:polyhydroxyalkanoic acid system family protein [Myxococcota bacterium]
MAQIQMKRSHALGAEKARGQIELLADRMAERLGGAWRWQGERAVCEARGARACVFYDATTVSIEVDLPLMLRPMKSVLESKLEEYFQRYFS